MNWFDILKYKDVVKPTTFDKLRRWDYEAGKKLFQSNPYKKLLITLQKLSTMKYTPTKFKYLASLMHQEISKVGDIDENAKEHYQNEVKAALDKLNTAWQIETNQSLNKHWVKMVGWFGR
tara:strand:- start:845 stop:1204 length:360 start_codon:yes stop_codon:yes gene_type:complete